MDSRLEKLKENLELAVKGMSTEQLSWHLPGKWCGAEVLEHLYLTYAATIEGLEKVITSGKSLATKASMAQRALTFVVVGLGHMPARRKAPAIAERRGLPAEQVRNEIGAKLVAMDAIIAQCEARFGRQIKLRDHPILGPLTAPQWRKLHVVHGRHHLKQLLRLRESTTRQMGSTPAIAVFSSKLDRSQKAMKPTVLYRIASVLLIFLAAGHTIAILKLKPPSPESEAVWKSMNSVHFRLGRGEYSYGGFYRGIGLFVTIYLLFAAYLAWYLGGMARHNPQAIGSLGWAFFALQLASIALSAIYFFLPPIVLSTLVAICVGLAAWGIRGAKP
jgi:hypothetical protein